MTAALMRGADLIGRPVVDTATGNKLAEIRDVIFDPARGCVTGFTLRRGGFLGRRMKELLAASAVTSIGTHAVMVVSSDALVHPDDAPDEVVADRRDDVLHDAVITESGRTLGTVKDVIVLGGGAPQIVAFEVTGGSVGAGLVPIAAASGVSGSALIVPDGYESRIRSDLTGLAAELGDLEGLRA